MTLKRCAQGICPWEGAISSHPMSCPLLSEFMGKYPSVDVKMTESTTNDLETQLFSGSLDLVIDNYPFSDSIYERHFFCREQLLLAVPAALVHGKQPEAFCLDASSIKDSSYEDSAVCPSIIQYFASALFCCCGQAMTHVSALTCS